LTRIPSRTLDSSRCFGTPTTRVCCCPSRSTSPRSGPSPQHSTKRPNGRSARSPRKHPRKHPRKKSNCSSDHSKRNCSNCSNCNRLNSKRVWRRVAAPLEAPQPSYSTFATTTKTTKVTWVQTTKAANPPPWQALALSLLLLLLPMRLPPFRIEQQQQQQHKRRCRR